MRIIILLFFFVFLNAEQILKYDVSVHVLEDGKLDVVETILYDFSDNKKHGIFRNIPINNNKIKLVSITQDNYPAKYESYYSDGDEVFKIGDKNIVLNGKHLYKIHYIMDRVVFQKDNKTNVISFNAIGTGWNVLINNVKIDIYLPYILTGSKIKVFIGMKNSHTEYKYKKVNLNHYQIIAKQLPPHSGITFDISFNKNIIKVQTLPTIWAIIFLILFSIGVYIYYSKHKVPYIAISPQYYPPKDLDILKAGLLIDQKADTKDFSSAILELATKGYLKIITAQAKKFGFFDTEVIVLQKLKNSEGLSYDQQKLFDTIFYNTTEFVLGKKDASIATSLRSMMTSVNNWLYSWAIKEGYLKENPKNAQITFVVKTGLFVIPFFIVAVFQMYNFYGELIVFYIMMLIFVVVGIYILLKEGIKNKIFGIIFLGFAFLMLKSSIVSLFNPLIFVVLSIIPILFFSKRVSSYSIKGIKSLKYLLGLKEFILKVEKEKLEFLVKENPNYLDDILPYAVLFGAKHWFDFYNEFEVNNDWYEGEYIYFSNLDKGLIDSFDSTANYVEASSSSDSFSGGGSVGSGSGGGGGGSW